MLGVVTVGVYGFDGESFLRALREADARLVLDVRQLRGVRRRLTVRHGVTIGHLRPR
jgi:hypothetical protein